MREERFFGKNYHFVWSDNWCLDDDEIWFMSGPMDLLFCIDCKTKLASVVAEVPAERICAFRLHPRCKKRGNKVFCLPDNGEDIWCYHIPDNLWSRIPVKNPNGIRLLCSNAWFVNDRMFILSNGSKQIIELDVNREEIVKYYDFPCDDNEKIAESKFVNNCIYVVGTYPVKIYKFNCKNKKIDIFLLSKIDDQIQTLCFDGEKFWLSGRCRKVYIWKEDERRVTVLDSFPKSFGIYNFNGNYEQFLNCSQDSKDLPLFIESVCVGNFVWLIPFQTNEILYIDKDTLEINIFPLENELITEKNIKEQLLQSKYIVEYIKDECYLGFFSLKNKWVVEIDSQKLEYKVLDYRLDKDSISRIDEHILYEIFISNNIVYEREQLGIHEFVDHLKSQDQCGKNGEKEKGEDKNYIGKKIFSFLTSKDNQVR